MVIIILIITTHLLSTYSTSGMVPGALNEFSHGLLPSTPAKSFSLVDFHIYQELTICTGTVQSVFNVYYSIYTLLQVYTINTTMPIL